MLRNLAWSILLVSPQALVAQNWCPPGATWTYSITDDVPYAWHGFLVVTYARDTLWGGHPGQVFSSHAVMVLGDLGFTSVSDVDVSNITWVEGDVVHAPTTWDTLYNFAAVPGDFWYGSTYARVNCPGDPLAVLDTGHVMVDGLSLRYVDVDNGVNGLHRIIERIGYDLWMTPQLNCVPPSAIATLRCYHDDEIDYVAPGWSGPCEGIVGIGEQVIGSSSYVFPDPGADHFTLSLPPGPHSIALFDATGRLTLQQRTIDERATIATAHLPSGTYVVRVDEGRPMRWVKQ